MLIKDFILPARRRFAVDFTGCLIWVNMGTTQSELMFSGLLLIADLQRRTQTRGVEIGYGAVVHTFKLEHRIMRVAPRDRPRPLFANLPFDPRNQMDALFPMGYNELTFCGIGTVAVDDKFHGDHVCDRRNVFGRSPYPFAF
jgi:hypothetical protein